MTVNPRHKELRHEGADANIIQGDIRLIDLVSMVNYRFSRKPTTRNWTERLAILTFHGRCRRLEALGACWEEGNKQQEA